MSNQLDLSELTTKQLTDLLRTLRGTSQAQIIYRELSHRPPQLTLKPDDPDWDHKFSVLLTQHFSPSKQS